MQRLHSSAALVVSVIALFVALGGSALAISQIGTSQIQDGAVTTSKLHKQAVTTGKLANNAVTTSKLANNSVTSAQVKDGSLTAGDVAPNTFLAANGTAANSQQLGGLPANQYVQGRGSQVFRQAVVQPGGSLEFLSVGFGTLTGNCSGANVPSITWTPSVKNMTFVATTTTYPATVKIDTANAIGAGVPFPLTPGGPQTATLQVSYNDGVQDHVATIWATDEYQNPTGCVFIGQAVTTG